MTGPRLLGRFARSLSGRIAIILTLGMVSSTYAALMVSEYVRAADISRMRSDRVLVGAIDIVARLTRDPQATLEAISQQRIGGATIVADTAAQEVLADPRIGLALAGRFAPSVRATIGQVSPSSCRGRDPLGGTDIAGFQSPGPPTCWLVSANGPDGVRRHVALKFWMMPIPDSGLLNPIYFVFILIACAMLSGLVASLALAPLKRISGAAARFADSIDAGPISETGPEDVRQALAAFNTMQARVREGIHERTRMLASISHDLQTPLTRLRLRLEQVEDVALRERLVADLTAALTMVHRGLDLARSGDTAEALTCVHIDSVLSSIAEDAFELGHDVRFVRGCGTSVWVKPDALSRCLGNLVDNALRYAGHATITCEDDGQVVTVTVADRGPGLATELLERVFEPLVRGDYSPSSGHGTGIGLTIARAQAASFDGKVSLRRREGGGLEALVSIPRP